MDLIDVSVNTKGAFLSRLKSAWHGLGEVLPNLDIRTILGTPGMGYRVGLESLTTTESGKIVPGQYATVRSDTLAPLAIVGYRYNVIQHVDEFSLFDEVLTPAGYQYETAGVIKGGAEVFLLAKRPENILVAEGDEVRQFLLFRFSYDGKTCMNVKTVAERVVCNNTLSIALSERGSNFDHRIRHTASAQDRLQDLRDTLQVASEAFQRFEQTAQAMAKTPFGGQQMKTAMESAVVAAYGLKPTEDDAVARYKKAVSEMMDSIGENLKSPLQNVDGIGGSTWSLYNAISQWADHEFANGVKGSQRAKAERRFLSIIGGRADGVKQAAWQSLAA